MKHARLVAAGLVAVLALAPDSGFAPAPPVAWKDLEPGLSYAAFHPEPPVPIGGGVLHVVRIDPERAHLRVAMWSASEGGLRTAAEWCDAERLAVAINMRMYATDFRSNVGYPRGREPRPRLHEEGAFGSAAARLSSAVFR